MNHIDPVCGKVLMSTEALATIPHEESLYRFCSQECHGRFWANPSLYVPEELTDNGPDDVLPTPKRSVPLPWHLTE